MKGYVVSCGYMGLIGGPVGGIYRLFATEGDYIEYMEDEEGGEEDE